MAVNAMSDITAVENVPKGAVLNRFCDQLAPHGTTGDGDWVPLIEGHGRYCRTFRLRQSNYQEPVKSVSFCKG